MVLGLGAPPLIDDPPNQSLPEDVPVLGFLAGGELDLFLGTSRFEGQRRPQYPSKEDTCAVQEHSSLSSPSADNRSTTPSWTDYGSQHTGDSKDDDAQLHRPWADLAAPFFCVRMVSPPPAMPPQWPPTTLSKLSHLCLLPVVLPPAATPTTTSRAASRRRAESRSLHHNIGDRPA